MSGIGISLNPFDIFNYNQAADQFNTSRSDSLRQADIDNKFRTSQWNYYKGQQNVLFGERHMRLQNLVRDAKKAGIGINAVLGSGGASPMQVNMPTGQGGRVSGNYGRNPVLNDVMKFQLEQQAKSSILDNNIKHEQWQKLQTERQILLKEYSDMFAPKSFDPRIGMYVPVYDNRDELTGRYGDTVTLFPNPDINLETPESLGMYYYGKGQLDPTTSTDWDDFSIYE